MKTNKCCEEILLKKWHYRKCEPSSNIHDLRNNTLKKHNKTDRRPWRDFKYTVDK
jgi:hypothetical protein